MKKGAMTSVGLDLLAILYQSYVSYPRGSELVGKVTIQDPTTLQPTYTDLSKPPVSDSYQQGPLLKLV
jgi:hypothetical protein